MDDLTLQRNLGGYPARKPNEFGESLLYQDDEVVLQCTATIHKEQQKLCLAAEGFGNRLCFLESTSNSKFRSNRSVHCRKMGPVYLSILLTCVFLLVVKIFFNDFVEYVFCAFELVFFSFFYSYYSK
ncbi:hypothetical protein STEG23_019319, partial [Scotinomys teguina]